MEGDEEYWIRFCEGRMAFCAIMILIGLALFVCFGWWLLIVPIWWLTKEMLWFGRAAAKFEELLSVTMQDLGFHRREVIAPGVVMYTNTRYRHE